MAFDDSVWPCRSWKVGGFPAGNRGILKILGAANYYWGDFNLIRSESDKSNGVGDRRLMNAFNCFIEECELREMYRGALDLRGQIIRRCLSKAILTGCCLWMSGISNIQLVL
jgi:hypothetical protein